MAPKIQIKSSKQRYAYGETIFLDIHLVNTARTPVYIAYERVSVERTKEGNLLVTLGQSKPDEEYEYYNYIHPKIRRISGKWFFSRLFRWNQWRGTIRFGMPLLETVFDSEGNADWSDIEVSGNVQLQFRLGYGEKPLQIDTTNPDPLETYLKWQKFTTSNLIQLFIEPAGSR